MDSACRQEKLEVKKCSAAKRPARQVISAGSVERGFTQGVGIGGKEPSGAYQSAGSTMMVWFTVIVTGMSE